MKKIGMLSLAALAVTAGLALSPPLRAEESRGSHGPGMMGSGMMPMAGEMTEQCIRMMQSAKNDRATPKDQPQETPPASPDRKG